MEDESFFYAFKNKKMGEHLHSAHQQTNPLSFQPLHYSLCVHFLLIRLNVWCIPLTWHNDADKTVANLLILVTDSNLVGNEVVLTTMPYYIHSQANNLVGIITATVCLNDFYTHLKEAFDVIILIPCLWEGGGGKSGNDFSIRLSVNPLPHLVPLLTGNDWATVSTTLLSLL